MPILQTVDETNRLYLPSTAFLTQDEQAWIDLHTEILVSDLERSNLGSSDVSNNVTSTIKLIACMAVAWNFTDADGKTLPINEDTIRHLVLEDFQAISEVLNKQRVALPLPLEDKKKSFSGSAPETTETPQT